MELLRQHISDANNTIAELVKQNTQLEANKPPTSDDNQSASSATQPAFDKESLVSEIAANTKQERENLSLELKELHEAFGNAAAAEVSQEGCRSLTGGLRLSFRLYAWRRSLLWPKR